MPVIRLVKRYPHIKDEDVTSIFQEGYIKGFENGRKGAIPIEWIEKWLNNIANNERYKSEYVELTKEVKRIVYRQAVIIRIPCISDMLEDWEIENGIRNTDS